MAKSAAGAATAKEYTATQKAAAKAAIALTAGAVGAGTYMKVARNRNAQNAQNAAAARAQQALAATRARVAHEVEQRRMAGRRGWHAARSNRVPGPFGQARLPQHPHGSFREGYMAGYNAFFDEGEL